MTMQKKSVRNLKKKSEKSSFEFSLMNLSNDSIMQNLKVEKLRYVDDSSLIYVNVREVFV